MSECLWESLTLVCGTRSTGAAGSGVGGYAEGNEAYNRHSSTPQGFGARIDACLGSVVIYRGATL